VLAGRIAAAREIQRVRYRKTRGAGGPTPSEGPSDTNASVSSRLLVATVSLDREARALMVTAADRLRLSARAYHRVLRVARTIADLDAESAVNAAHVAEALRYRPVSAEPSPQGHPAGPASADAPAIRSPAPDGRT
jgi:magnesium chelatase family protein